MNTPTHLVLNLAALGSGERRRLVPPILAGALLPDLPMFVFFAWERWVVGASHALIWGDRYFDPAWQRIFDLFNSIPLGLAGLGLALALRRRGVAVFFASLVLHCLCDLPLHREDGHRHLFPLSDWRFMSPVSYWDPAYGGGAFALFETGLVLGGSALLWRRHPGRVARALLLVACALHLAGAGLFLVLG